MMTEISSGVEVWTGRVELWFPFAEGGRRPSANAPLSAPPRHPRSSRLQLATGNHDNCYRKHWMWLTWRARWRRVRRWLARVSNWGEERCDLHHGEMSAPPISSSVTNNAFASPRVIQDQSPGRLGDPRVQSPRPEGCALSRSGAYVYRALSWLSLASGQRQ